MDFVNSACRVVPVLRAPEAPFTPAALLLPAAAEPLSGPLVWFDCETLPFAPPFTLVDVAGVDALWLALAPALAWPGVTEALPDAEPPAEVCATAPVATKPATIAAIQNVLIVNLFLSA
jgi:hypothetical protein